MDVRLSRPLAVVAVAAAIVGLSCSPGGTGGGTPAPDCSTVVAPASCPTPAPSWKGGVQQLFAGYCAQCHGAGGVAASIVPMATYQDVANNRTRIWEAIYSCTMPGGQDAGVTPMAYPSVAQRNTMIAWADACNAPNN